jgi:hypothetical protein
MRQALLAYRATTQDAFSCTVMINTSGLSPGFHRNEERPFWPLPNSRFLPDTGGPVRQCERARLNIKQFKRSFRVAR